MNDGYEGGWLMTVAVTTVTSRRVADDRGRYDGYDGYDGGWLVADDRGRDSGCDDHGGISHAWHRKVR